MIAGQAVIEHVLYGGKLCVPSACCTFGSEYKTDCGLGLTAGRIQMESVGPASRLIPSSAVGVETDSRDGMIPICAKRR